MACHVPQTSDISDMRYLNCKEYMVNSNTAPYIMIYKNKEYIESTTQSKIIGGWRLANGPPRASNIRRYIADISKYNSKQGQQMTNSNIHSPIYLCKKKNI